jgi:hypothetical protein
VTVSPVISTRAYPTSGLFRGSERRTPATVGKKASLSLLVSLSATSTLQVSPMGVSQNVNVGSPGVSPDLARPTLHSGVSPEDSKGAILASMKVALALLLILLLLLIPLPLGMGHMGDCPACTAAKSPFALGICAGILSFFALIVLLAGSQLRPAEESARRLLLARSVYRPPRFA